MSTISRTEDIKCQYCNRVWQVDTRVGEKKNKTDYFRCLCNSGIGIEGSIIASRLVEVEGIATSEEVLHRKAVEEAYNKGYLDGLSKCFAKLKEAVEEKERGFNDPVLTGCLWFPLFSKECYGKTCAHRSQCNAWQNKK